MSLAKALRKSTNLMEMELKKEKVVKKLVNIKLNSCRFNN